jgi:hypothetical protein
MEIKNVSEEDFNEEPFEVLALNDYGSSMFAVNLTNDEDEGTGLFYGFWLIIVTQFFCAQAESSRYCLLSS